MDEELIKTVSEADNDNVSEAERFRNLASAMDGGEVKLIFRRFGDLTTLNLLILQAEVLQLQASFDAVSLTNTDEYQGYLATYSLGKRPTETVNQQSLGKKTKHKSDLLKKLREKLKEYSPSGSPA